MIHVIEPSLSTDTQKVGVLTKIGYGVGQMGDSIGYNVFYSFFLFFLTDIIGLSPSIAGIVSLLAVLWDAVTDPILGFWSDNFKGKNGRRRPFMLASALPYGICMFLLFNDISIPESVKGPYFIVISMLFFTFYTAYVIPYFALGSELTENFDERTSIRVFASIFMYISVLIASAAPHMIVEITQRHGGTVVQGWRNVGIIFGLMIAASILLCWVFTKGKEKPVQEKEKEKFSEIIKSYISIMKLKPSRILALTIIFWTFTSSLRQSASMYLTANMLGYSAELRSTLSVIFSVMAILWLPVINFLSKKLDKKYSYGFAMLLSGASLFLFRFIGFPSPGFMAVMIVMYTLGNTTFWTISYSMMYDISGFDEFASGKQRAGAITAIMSFFQKLGSAVSLWFAGVLLEMGGYVPGTAFTPETSKLILNLNTSMPGIVGIVTGLVALLYPITKKKYEAMMEAKKLKERGEAYTTEGFKGVL